MVLRSFALLAAFSPVLVAQIGPMDITFAGLSARTRLRAYQEKGGDTAPIAPLMADAGNADRVHAYRSLTHALVLMGGAAWTPDTELPTALDFSIDAKVVGTGENLSARATFLFDAPAAALPPYRMRLDLLSGTKVEAAVEHDIALGDVRGRRGGDTIGVVFDPSKLVQSGLHSLQATLEDGHGTRLFQYYRTFSIVPDLKKRVETLEKTLELLTDQRQPAALTIRQVLETVQTAHQTYFGTGFQNLTGYIFTGMRASGLGLKEPLDFDGELPRSARLAEALEQHKDPFAGATGDLRMAYRSTFDGKLVPYRVYLPLKYDASRKYPLIVLLHGAGGDESDFLEGYAQQFPKLADAHGYILASVSGRGPVTGYAKANGSEQDVIDVMDIVKSRYSVDPSRIYLGGHSMGGGGTWRVGGVYADRFAGLIPIAGTNSAVLAGLDAWVKRKMPVMIVCGEKDALVAVAGCREVAEKAKAAGAPVHYAEYAAGDHLSVVAMAAPDIFTWLDEQQHR
jgi:poly(3-hydroxybutyrate) depolymerase